MLNFFNKKMMEVQINGLITIGRYSEAYELINKVMDEEETNHILWHNKGVCLYYMEKYNEAYDCFKKSLEIKNDFRDSIIYLANTERARGNLEDAVQLYEEADSIIRLNKKDMMRYVKSLESIGKYDKALEYIKAFPNINPIQYTDTELQLTKVRIYLKTGKPKDALYIIEKIAPLNIQKDVRIDIYKADALLRLGRYDEATFIIEMLMKQIPNSSYVKSLHSKLLLEQDKYDDALDSVEDGLKARPDDARLHCVKIELLIKTDKLKEAMINLEGSSNVITEIDYINYKSLIFFKMGEQKKAEEYINKAIEIDSENIKTSIINAEIILSKINDNEIDNKIVEKSLSMLENALLKAKDADIIKYVNKLQRKLKESVNMT